MLELKNVCKTFHAGTPDEKKALIDISLKIEDGDFVSIIGANGAGKSTLFNAICGSFVLDSGSIYLGGKNVTMVPEHQRARQIGRLFQDPMRGSAPDMSIEENLAGGQRQALTLLMATYHVPKVLLLDEHTAALDPGTAEKVLELTQNIVEENHITCLMITHNMQSALDLGNRTLMMDRGKVIYDVTGEERASLTIGDLTDKFRQLSGRTLDNDRMLLRT